MRIGSRSSLATVAVAVGDALRRHGIRAVLTGGACASLYTRGAYQSRDMDFIVVGPVTQPGLDHAMASVGSLPAEMPGLRLAEGLGEDRQDRAHVLHPLLYWAAWRRETAP